MFLGYFVITLETRQKITRVLCWIDLFLRLVVAPVLAAGIVWMLAAVFGALAGNGAGVLTYNLLGAAIAVGLTSTLIELFLSTWRKCDQCGGRLFQRGNAERTHVRTQRLLGSQRLGAEWEMARTGTAHCRWCGHADGKPVEYVRLGPEQGVASWDNG